MWSHDTGCMADRPQAALFAYEMGRIGMWLPKMTFLCWIIGLAIYRINDTWQNGIVAQSIVNQDSFFFATQILPPMAMLVSAFLWEPHTTWKGWFRGKTSRAEWIVGIPATVQQRAQALRSVAAANMGVTLVCVTVVQVGVLLFADNAIAAKLLGDAWINGEASLREVFTICLGPMLLTGLLSWIAMTFSGGSIFLSGIIALELHLVLNAGKAPGFWDGYALNFTVSCAWFLLLLPTLLVVSMTIMLARRRVISSCSVLASTGVGLFIAGVIFPWTLSYSPAWDASWISRGGLAIFCLCLSAWAAFSWAPAMFRMQPTGGAVHPREAPAAPQQCHANGRRGRPMLVVTAIIMMLFFAWLRWPEEPKIRQTLRAEQLPYNSVTLNKWYAQIEPEENLALKYLSANEEESRLTAEWQEVLEERSATPDEPSAKDLENRVLEINGQPTGRTGEISPEEWAATMEYWRMVGAPVAVLLHDAAASNLAKSRYPVDYTLGYQAEHKHLAKLRSLARILAIESLAALSEDRQEDALAALFAILPVANSLQEEPSLLAHLVRMSMLGKLTQNVEVLLNRAEFDGELLALAMNFFDDFPSTPVVESFSSRALAGELALALDYAGAYQHQLPNPGAITSSYAVLLGSTAFPLLNLYGADTLERVVSANSIRRMKSAVFDAVRTNILSKPDTLILWREDSCLGRRTLMPRILLPAFLRAVEPELRTRTQFALARTALAVERYRLENGKLPDTLEMLVPAYLDRIPTDPWNNGNPVSYRIRENGEFVVYSIGGNRTDEKGEEIPEWWLKGDITFTVAPIGLRDRIGVGK